MHHAVVALLGRIRIHPKRKEREVCDEIERALLAANISFVREQSLDDLGRIDFLCEGGIGIEVKPGKPNLAALKNQVARYGLHDSVKAIIVCVEGSVYFDSMTLKNGKPVSCISLRSNWGVAV